MNIRYFGYDIRKKEISSAEKSSTMADLRSGKTANGLKGSFLLLGSSIIEQASESNQYIFACLGLSTSRFFGSL